MRAMVYDILDEHILGTACFGLRGKTEKGLIQFEAVLNYVYPDMCFDLSTSPDQP